MFAPKVESHDHLLEWCTDTAIHRNFCHVNFFRGFCPTVSVTGLATQGMLEVLLRPVVVVFHPTTVLHLPWSGLPGARDQRIEIHRKQGANMDIPSMFGDFFAIDDLIHVQIWIPENGLWLPLIFCVASSGIFVVEVEPRFMLLKSQHGHCMFRLFG